MEAGCWTRRHEWYGRSLAGLDQAAIFKPGYGVLARLSRNEALHMFGADIFEKEIAACRAIQKDRARTDEAEAQIGAKAVR